MTGAAQGIAAQGLGAQHKKPAWGAHFTINK
jgi:hypothetical protein